MNQILRRLKEVGRYPSAVLGLVLVTFLIGVSLYAIISIPYSEAIRLWRGGPGVWEENPRTAQPLWYDLFIPGKASRTIVANSATVGTKVVEPLGGGMNRVEITLPVDFGYDGFPTEVSLFTRITKEGTARTSVEIAWRTPDGREIPIHANYRARPIDTYHISQDSALRDRLGGPPQQALFTDMSVAPGAQGRVPIRGEYALVLTAQIRDEEDLNAKLIVYGQVHGLAGTDHERRDMMVALLWGTPLALLFGLLGAVGASMTTFILAGIGTWYGGKLDFIFQRITNVNMILPMLPILIMVGQFYGRSIWLMLGVVIALSIFSSGMITYRAMFLQAKEAAYIEAAQAYGAKNLRIVFRYLLPRIAPTLLPGFVLVIPSFVFLEAGLAVLGLGDPILPTWGKLIYDARIRDALYLGQYYWVVQPAILLMLTGFGFALVGYALDRVFNPRLRTV